MADPKVYVDVQFILKSGLVEAISYLEGRDTVHPVEDTLCITTKESPQISESLEVRLSEVAARRTITRIVED